MKRNTLIFIAVCACLSVFGYVNAEQGDYSTLGYSTSGGYSLWRVDSSGYFKPGYDNTYDIGTAALRVRNIYVGTGIVGGTLTSTTLTSPTMTSPSVTGGMSVIGGVHVSTSATSSNACQMVGAVAALPTSGYTECDTAFLLSDHKMYVATNTVTTTGCWVALN